MIIPPCPAACVGAGNPSHGTFVQYLNARENQDDSLHVIDYLDDRKKMEDLRRVLRGSDIVGLVTPMYVDGLPYPVVWFMERLNADFADELRGKGFFAIGQCGFPDDSLLNPLLASCRLFATASGMQWHGGLGFGGGPMINGANLENLGGRGKKISGALSILLEDVFNCRAVSPGAQRMISMGMPRILNAPMAAFLSYRARKTARRLGIDLRARPYQD